MASKNIERTFALIETAQGDLSPIERLFLLYLASLCNERETQYIPRGHTVRGVPASEIARATGVSRRRVFLTIKRLESAGYITVGRSLRRRPNLFALRHLRRAKD